MFEAHDIIARTRRFAHLIARDAEEADRYLFDVVEAEHTQLSIATNGDDLRNHLYRSLCDRISTHEATPSQSHSDGEEELQPVIWRFRQLPLVNRMAFALMVIEEIPSSTTAHILRIPDITLEEKIQQSRKILFEE